MLLQLAVTAALAMRPASPGRNVDRMAGTTLTRRAALLGLPAATLLLAPSAANAMTIPGLNAPGLVPATKKPAGATPRLEPYRDPSHLSSSRGSHRPPIPIGILRWSGDEAATGRRWRPQGGGPGTGTQSLRATSKNL